jgi:hypothetical protein
MALLFDLEYLLIIVIFEKKTWNFDFKFDLRFFSWCFYGYKAYNKLNLIID